MTTKYDEHEKDKEIIACYKVITTQGLSDNHEIIDIVGALEPIEPTKYEVAKDSKIGSIKLQLLDMGITEIASAVGFASNSHFTKAFRQTTGTTPLKYRKAAQRTI